MLTGTIEAAIRNIGRPFAARDRGDETRGVDAMASMLRSPEPVMPSRSGGERLSTSTIQASRRRVSSGERPYRGIRLAGYGALVGTVHVQRTITPGMSSGVGTWHRQPLEVVSASSDHESVLGSIFRHSGRGIGTAFWCIRWQAKSVSCNSPAPQHSHSHQFTACSQEAFRATLERRSVRDLERLPWQSGDGSTFVEPWTGMFIGRTVPPRNGVSVPTNPQSLLAAFGVTSNTSLSTAKTVDISSPL